ncbi:MAG: T9SS type A sorting domain-containing protein, partial [Rhodothermales bacterium]
LVVGAVTPRVEIAGDGSFVIIYTGGSGTNRSILTRRYTSTGTPDGDQVTISASPGLLQWPTVTMLFNQLLKNGYIVTWEKVQPPSIYGDIYMQCVDNQGRLVGNNILVSLPSDSGQGRPGIATLGFGNTNPPNNRSMLVWHDDRIGDLDIWAQLVINECNPNGANFLVNGRSEGRTNQAFSALDATAEGQSIVLWEDDRNVAAGVDIYAKRLDPDDNPLGPDFKINDDAGSQDQREPDVAVHPDGASVAVWADYRRDADGDIFAQRFDANGSPLGSNVVVNDTLSAGGQRTPAVAMKQDGGFAVTWVDTRRMPQGDIFVQSFDADGNPDGGNTRVNTDDSGEQHRDPALAIRRSGEMVITWADAREGDFDVWAQRYDADGNPDGGNTRVNTLSDNVQMLPAVDAAPGGVYLIAWVDYLNTPNGDIMAQRYGDAGPIDGNFQVNDEDNVANPFPFEFPFGPSVAAVPATRSTQRDSTFVVAWTDFRSGTQDPNIYAQCYLASGAPLGTNFRVDDAPVESWQVAPDVARNARDPNGLYFSWTDERTFATEGQSIWGKLFVWDKPVNTSVEQSEGEVPADFVLRQNYPNPFNPQTTIPFAVPVSSRVVLRVFNAMGQQVATLVDGTYAPGHYQATFDAAGLPSGAYFYRIEMGGVHAVRQMVLLK